MRQGRMGRSYTGTDGRSSKRQQGRGAYQEPSFKATTARGKRLKNQTAGIQKLFKGAKGDEAERKKELTSNKRGGKEGKIEMGRSTVGWKTWTTGSQGNWRCHITQRCPVACRRACTSDALRRSLRLR
ncbi:hypothetical protein R1sor_011321 [Riccia sorocarpa]|uniref:Uncharacterized protein n=1 Tax=Riccia sorocarpa TaxID=122646 RepID=A0ABD3I0H5_9MARC